MMYYDCSSSSPMRNLTRFEYFFLNSSTSPGGAKLVFSFLGSEDWFKGVVVKSTILCVWSASCGVNGGALLAIFCFLFFCLGLTDNGDVGDGSLRVSDLAFDGVMSVVMVTCNTYTYMLVMD